MTRFMGRREASPLFWTFLCDEFFGLSRQQAEQWWHALQRARWSRPVALRGIILCRAALGERQGSLHHFVTENFTPSVLIHVLEDLIRERLLAPATARQIEEAVLAKTHVSGLWV
jgi:hypothetical protein